MFAFIKWKYIPKIEIEYAIVDRFYFTVNNIALSINFFLRNSNTIEVSNGNVMLRYEEYTAFIFDVFPIFIWTLLS